MFIPDPGSWFLPIPDPGSRIPDPKTATKEWDEKKLVVVPFFVVIILPNWKLFYFSNAEEKIWAHFQRIIELFTHKLSLNMGLGSGIRDLGSGIRKKPIPDPGARCLKGTGSRIRIRNTGVTCNFCLPVPPIQLSHWRYIIVLCDPPPTPVLFPFWLSPILLSR